jgi:hypothetical protein
METNYQFNCGLGIELSMVGVWVRLNEAVFRHTKLTFLYLVRRVYGNYGRTKSIKYILVRPIIYGGASKLPELSVSECNEFWGKHEERISAYEKLKILSITGGVPRYLEFINSNKSAEDNIRTMCFSPNAPLLNGVKDAIVETGYFAKIIDFGEILSGK